LGAVAVAVTTAPAQARQGFVWPDGKRAALSLTYDDGLTGQLQIAEPQLEAHGFKATFFLTQVNMQDRIADWQALARKGHEIGDHTVDHPCELRPFTARSFAQREILPMEAFEAEHFGKAPERLYAYPCGATELGRSGDLNQRQRRYLSVVRRNFAAARIVDGGPNDPRLVSRFRYLLQANAPTYDQDDAKLAFSYAQSAIDRGYWAILIFHDVVERRQASGETSRATHAAILDWISAQPLWCAPMGQVFDYVRRQEASAA
jgi:peptidoglycan/xylan/chitin deacetylase (PgdA/CDA1 family)